MKNIWNKTTAAKLTSDLERRVYSSQLIGADANLVLHGGGNTSLKSTTVNRFGETENIIWVKASGFDLATMGAEGYTALTLDKVLRLAQLDNLSDEDMVNDLKVARLNPNAAGASIEAIVHALIPYKYVDHTHANAVLTISNTPNGLQTLKNIYGDTVLFLPYIKPGFDLALQFRDAIKNGGLKAISAVILEHHGVFTFSDDAKISYDTMVSTIAKAEQYLIDTHGEIEPVTHSAQNPVSIAQFRKAASNVAGQALISRPIKGVADTSSERIALALRSGTLTPEHVLHNKPFPAFIKSADAEAEVDKYQQEYRAYFERANDASLSMIKPFPHWGIYSDGRSRSFGVNLKRACISADVGEATLKALEYADKLGGWQGLTESQLRDIEYWELEQAKLKAQKPGPELTGKIAVVSGAAAGIGQACAQLLSDKGAVVVGLDINPDILDVMNKTGFEGKIVDLTNEPAVADALSDVVNSYGGIDILVSNAGIFRTGATIETLEDNNWDSTLAVNLSSHRMLLKQAIPYLKHGINPGVVFMGSRNVHAPGAGAAAYSVSKAGLTQLMRVAALELVGDGITVNIVHPDAVFDTKLWTDEALEKSAARYGISIEAYKTRNLLKTEIRSRDVALATLAFVDGTLSKTTGAQLPVDGGNDRVI